MIRTTLKSLATGLVAATIAAAAPAAADGTMSWETGPNGSLTLHFNPRWHEQADSVPGGAAYQWMTGQRTRGSIGQYGNENAAGIAQNGRGNAGIVRQQGNSNSATLRQNGDNNAYAILQYGNGGNLDVEQTGNGRTGASIQFNR